MVLYRIVVFLYLDYFSPERASIGIRAGSEKKGCSGYDPSKTYE
jgi:hypothetical protein